MLVNRNFALIGFSVAVNFDGVVNTVEPLIARMSLRRQGQLGVMSSLAGFVGRPTSAAYNASKAALRVWGESIRFPLQKDNVGVSVICPGYVNSRMTADISGVMPFVGHWMVRFLRGGDRVSGGTLSRFYGWHVALLPAITTVVLVVHLALVQLKGMSVPAACEEESSRRKPMKFFPHFALRDLSGWIFALGVLAALAALFPWELGEKADLFAPAYENIRPEWYFVFMFQTLKLVPGGEIFGIEYEAIPILLFSAAGLLLILIPFLDRGAALRGRSPGWSIGGVAALLFALGMTCWGYASLLPLYVVLISTLLLSLLAFITRGRKSEDR